MSCLAQSSPASEPSKAQQQVVTCWLHFQLPEQVSCRPRFPQPRQGELKIRLPASLSKALQWWAGHELTEPLSAAAAVRTASTRGGGRPIRHSTCGHTLSLKMNEGKENPSFEKNKTHEKHENSIPNNLVDSEWCELTKISRNSKTHTHTSSILPGCNLANGSPSTGHVKGVGRSQAPHLPLASSPQRGTRWSGRWARVGGPGSAQLTSPVAVKSGPRQPPTSQQMLDKLVGWTRGHPGPPSSGVPEHPPWKHVLKIRT